MTKPIKLSTPVTLPAQEDKIACRSKILTLGSCFSDNIGNLLKQHLFDTLVNPFGTVFNPISVAKVLKMALNKDELTASDLNVEGSRYFHYDFHSSFDNSVPKLVAEEINNAIYKVGECLPRLDFLVLTFGTSIVYKLKASDQIVSNCHKVPNSNFWKEFMSIDFMESNVIEVIDLIRTINPSLKIVLTVSPVRHIKEGLIGNSRSKSRLIDLCHRLVEGKEDITYFPAYEIMIDELRDYRYYKSDLIHPSNLAIDIIWSRFMEYYSDKSAIQKVKDIGELNAAMNHRPFDSNSEEHKKFKQNQLKKIDQYSKIYPEIDFTKMIQFFNS